MLPSIDVLLPLFERVSNGVGHSIENTIRAVLVVAFLLSHGVALAGSSEKGFCGDKRF